MYLGFHETILVIRQESQFGMGENSAVWRSMFSILWKILLFVVLLLVVATYWFRDDLTFRKINPTYHSDYRYFALVRSNDEKVACRFLSNQSSRYLIVYSHGGGEDLGQIEPILQEFRHVGLNVIAYDYPGYGLSSGKSTESASYDALEAVLFFAVDQLGFPSDKIILHGRSLGAGPSIEMCQRHELGGLIVESAYQSAFQFSFGVSWLPWDRFKNLSKVKRIDESTLVIHGIEDPLIPFEYAREFYERLECPKLYYWAESAGHNDLVAVLGDEYWRLIEDFVRYLDVDAQ